MSADVRLRQLLKHIEKIERRGVTTMVALDGASGAGKSTLAAALAATGGTVVVDGDDFYAGGTAEKWDAMSAAEKAAHCIDWRRQVPVLAALRQGESASWHPYDWNVGDGRLLTRAVTCDPARLVVLDGVYSARPELSDLFDLRVLLDAPPKLRRSRLVEREGAHFLSEWHERWAEAERHYFSRIMPPEAFDLVIEG